MTRNDFTVGQTVYLKTISHLVDSWKKERVVKGVVSKIGRKYITVKYAFYEYRFNIENEFKQETEYAAEYELFLTEQAVYDYWQSAYLRAEINKFLARNGTRLQLRALKNMATILGIPLEPMDKSAFMNRSSACMEKYNDIEERVCDGQS